MRDPHLRQRRGAPTERHRALVSALISFSSFLIFFSSFLCGVILILTFGSRGASSFLTTGNALGFVPGNLSVSFGTVIFYQHGVLSRVPRLLQYLHKRSHSQRWICHFMSSRCKPAYSASKSLSSQEALMRSISAALSCMVPALLWIGAWK